MSHKMRMHNPIPRVAEANISLRLQFSRDESITGAYTIQ